MGNSDLLIIINNSKFIIRSRDYNRKWDALELAKTRYLAQIQRDRDSFDESESFDPESDYWDTDLKTVQIIELPF